MVDVNIHGSMQSIYQSSFVGTKSLMSSLDGLCLPVSPVDVLLEQRHGKDVRDVMVKNCESTNTQNNNLQFNSKRIRKDHNEGNIEYQY